jgi:hypothetical protein
MTIVLESISTSSQDETDIIDGGQAKTVVTNFTLEELQGQVLIELKKINLQLATLTDIIIKDEDISQNIV